MHYLLVHLKPENKCWALDKNKYVNGGVKVKELWVDVVKKCTSCNINAKLYTVCISEG